MLTQYSHSKVFSQQFLHQKYRNEYENILLLILLGFSRQNRLAPGHCSITRPPDRDLPMTQRVPAKEAVTRHTSCLGQNFCLGINGKICPTSLETLAKMGLLLIWSKFSGQKGPKPKCFVFHATIWPVWPSWWKVPSFSARAENSPCNQPVAAPP